jgi:catechol 2,3-dioxygenase-like lactoylglutathione lyase family enzyme
MKRRGALAITVVLLLFVGLGQLPRARGQAVPLVTRVESVGMTVSDLERSVDFYTRVLGFEKASAVEVAGEAFERLQGVFPARVRVAWLRLGDETLELTEYLTPRGRPIPPDARSQDASFQHVAIIVSDMGRAYARLREHRVAHVSPEPQRLPDWNPNAGGIVAFYFKDPDGHVLEILQFPPDKGDPKWRRRDGRLFLGIDHTAIVSADTARSLVFYRDLLGFRVAGTSENNGPEQERLNAVFGARLRITTLRASTGPGIELLEYLAPRDGRSLGADARANDLAHWQTRVGTDDVARAGAALDGARAHWISPGVVPVPGAPLGFRRGALVRDPDGHALQIVER